jgi:hypothetical protein
VMQTRRGCKREVKVKVVAIVSAKCDTGSNG